MTLPTPLPPSPSAALVAEREAARIPAAGPVIVLANRPASPAREAALLAALSARRADWLAWRSPARARRPGDAPDATAAALHLHHGGALLCFPAPPHPLPGARQGRWGKAALRLVREARVPVLPLHWKPADQTARTRVGQRLAPALFDRLPGRARLHRYLRARVHCLGLVPERAVGPSAEGTDRHPFLRVIRTPFDGTLLEGEIAALPAGALLLERGPFAVFAATAAQIPHLLCEIGRLREVAFHAAGEGSRQPIDLDEYDATYRHLFCWDRAERRLVGAYRLGMGPELLAVAGKRGFYLHSLFRIDDALVPLLGESLELGRSFVVPAYQGQRLPLFLLWQGITAWLERHPALRWLIGPVSISNHYAPVSRSLMVRYIRAHHFDAALARHVRPRKAFRPDFGRLDADALLEPLDGDPGSVDALIADLEPAHFRLPVLLRQYFAQHARIIGFNVDPDFSDALDGFMVCRVEDLGAAYRRWPAG